MRVFAKRLISWSTSDAIDPSEVPDHCSTGAVMTRSFNRSALATWRCVSHKGGNQFCQRDHSYAVKVQIYFNRVVQGHR